MLVSVIIPNYNHAAYLKDRIDSVLNQTFQDFEVIILDDCSTDNSRKIIEQYRGHPKVSQVEYNHKNSGSPFPQWKKGIELTKGKYIWIAESDDFAEVNFLEELVREIRKENVSLVYCQSRDVGQDGKMGNSRLYYTNDFNPNIWEQDFVKTGTELLEYLKVKCVIPNVSACVFKKDIIHQSLQQYDEISEFSMCGDWYLYFTIFKMQDVKVGFSAQVLNNFRETSQSTRYFSDISKKQTRVLEELRIVDVNRKLFSDIEYRERIQILRRKWFTYHNKSNLNSRFFSFGRRIGRGWLPFLFDFIKYKLIERKRPFEATR